MYQHTQKKAMIAVAVILLLLPVAAIAQSDRNPRDMSERKQEIADKVQERKDEAKEKLAEKREGRGRQSNENRKVSCEKHASKINTAFGRVTAKSANHLERLDGVVEKLQTLYIDEQLTVANYESLMDAIGVARAAAEVEVAALPELSVEVDCEDPDVAASIGAYRETASGVKETLKAYRSNIKDLAKEIREVAETAEGEDE